jgi:hypothetical protein
MEDQVTDLPTIKTPRVYSRKCMEALIEVDLDMNVEEVGDRDQHPEANMIFVGRPWGYRNSTIR